MDSLLPLCVWTVLAAVLALLFRWQRVSARLLVMLPGLMDLPFIVLLQWIRAQHSSTPGGVVAFNVAFFLLLILSSVLTLQVRVVLVVTVAAVVLQTLFLLSIQADAFGFISFLAVPVLGAVLAVLALGRMRKLIRRVLREQVAQARLSRYFAPAVAEHIVQLEQGSARGEEREVTILFADVRDFTTLSEQWSSLSLSGPRREVLRTLHAEGFDHGAVHAPVRHHPRVQQHGHAPLPRSHQP